MLRGSEQHLLVAKLPKCNSICNYGKALFMWKNRRSLAQLWCLIMFEGSLRFTSVMLKYI